MCSATLSFLAGSSSMPPAGDGEKESVSHDAREIARKLDEVSGLEKIWSRSCGAAVG